MHRLRHLSYANVAATLALLVAVAGVPTAIAITESTKRSDVNKKGNIRAGHVTAAKLANGNVTAAKLAGIDVVQVHGTGTATATCPSGERLLGGGASLNSSGGSGRDLQVSAPLGNAWHVAGGAGVGDVDAFALCLRTTAGS